MKRFAKSAFIFLVISILTFSYFNKVFRSSEVYNATFSDFEELADNTNIDILIFGSSHALTAYNPLIVNQYSKAISYNLGSSALRFSLTNVLLKEALKNTKPKLIIIEVFENSIRPPKSDEIKGFQLQALDVIPNLNQEKLDIMTTYYDDNEYLGFLFPLFRNHTQWNEKNYFNLDRSNRISYNGPYYYYNGYVASRKSLKKEDSIKYIDFKTVKEGKPVNKKKIDEKITREFSTLVSTAREAGAEVLFVSSPDITVPYNSHRFYEELEKICKALNTNLINYNDLYQELNIGLSDFADPTHLNLKGGLKVSKHLGEYIRNNYSLPDRSMSEYYLISENDKRTFFTDNYPSKATMKDPKHLLEDITLSRIEFYKDYTQSSLKILIKTTNPKELDQYNLGIHLTPTEEEKKFLHRPIDKERGHFIQDIALNSKDSIYETSFFAATKKYSKIRVFLYNKKKYSGSIGRDFIWNDIQFESTLSDPKVK